MQTVQLLNLANVSRKNPSSKNLMLLVAAVLAADNSDVGENYLSQWLTDLACIDLAIDLTCWSHFCRLLQDAHVWRCRFLKTKVARWFQNCSACFVCCCSTAFCFRWSTNLYICYLCSYWIRNPWTVQSSPRFFYFDHWSYQQIWALHGLKIRLKSPPENLR